MLGCGVICHRTRYGYGWGLDRRIEKPSSPFRRWKRSDDLIGKYEQDQAWYNVNRTDADNSRHDFWPLIKTDQNRLALIEYLKML